MSRLRSSRQRYLAFRKDYKEKKLDDSDESRAGPNRADTPAPDTEEPAETGVRGFLRGKRRQYLRNYLRWLRPHTRAVTVVFVLALIGFFLYSTQPVLNAWALDIAPPELGGTSIGILFASQSLLGGLAPVIGGVLADRYGIEAAFYFVAATVLAANLIIVTIRDDRGQVSAPAAG